MLINQKPFFLIQDCFENKYQFYYTSISFHSRTNSKLCSFLPFNLLNCFSCNFTIFTGEIVYGCEMIIVLGVMSILGSFSNFDNASEAASQVTLFVMCVSITFTSNPTMGEPSTVRVAVKCWQLFGLFSYLVHETDSSMHQKQPHKFHCLWCVLQSLSQAIQQCENHQQMNGLLWNE